MEMVWDTVPQAFVPLPFPEPKAVGRDLPWNVQMEGGPVLFSRSSAGSCALRQRRLRDGVIITPPN